MSNFSIFKNDNLMKLLSATLISQLGTQISFIALPLIAVTILHSSAFQVSVLNALDFLPFALFSLLIGAWVDKCNRRPIVIVSDVLRAMILLSVPVAIHFDMRSIWLLYIVVFAVGSFSVSFDVASETLLPTIIQKDELHSGNAALELSQSAAKIVGPSIAGGLILILSAPFAVIFDCISYMCSAAILLSLRVKEMRKGWPENVNTSKPSMVSEVREGMYFVLHHEFLKHFAIFSGLSNLGWSLIEGILMVYAVRTLHFGPGLIGIIFTISNIGLIAAASLSIIVLKLLPLGTTVIVSSMLQGVGIVFVSIASWYAPLLFMTLGLLLRSYGVVSYGINAVRIRQNITPDAMRGRVSATMRFISWSTIPIGSMVGGLLATGIGVPQAMDIGAILSVFAVIWIAVSPIRSIHMM
ncbi:MFS transporter [Ferroacidibacillus organovorans]|uniref:MFS transporter n=1 Tax=Ferroacidibacillus organovorans TaxID=1765683 RepID=A0A162S7Y6_9BACL|nr:MFS transporter [Ferroacidibacillus organovorans]KYP79600.1 hypothetical protein AYJ22_14055 [Ferroacidibacillus organovorans]OAG91660.1 hypothetical protein AYW79_13645 [Ferroacidibacillus organovorans]OPG17578.1 MFS transporter [Ferroacidibacillus organovorans]